ncbi:hypothetical protein AAG565_05015 [Fontimonas sp. SYSU GA230001]|uniref:hypothetical protein n=1 Tax=Fontimonas sp. SYSU GA230001 TaxID=3142450 RepID=UPI0032B4C2A1
MSTDDEHDGEVLPQLHGLRRERFPERDLWPDIAARIGTRRRRSVRPWAGFALAASVVAALSVGLWRNAPGPQAGPAAATAMSVSSASAARPGRVHPQQQALLKANLRIVQHAERELERALEQDPESESLQRLLQTVRDQRGALKARLQQT